jgi:Holliday junction resolvase-like predicted endonuclease
VNKNQIVHTALDRLMHHTGIEGQWKPNTKELHGELDFYINTKEFHMFVEVKSELRHYHLPQIFEMAKKFRPLLVVAEKICKKHRYKQNGCTKIIKH